MRVKAGEAAARIGARQVALRILERLFSTDRSAGGAARRDVGRGSLALMDFQQEAVERIRRLLRRRGGAVLADSVGLGKTHVALALVEEELGAGGDVVVIVPASTREQWRSPLRRLSDTGGRWRLLSHTQLARGAAIASSDGRSRLVVVDEAHRFRNPRTQRYAALARLITPSTRLLLITATPVNNRREDLLHLIRLFARDGAFQDLGVASLRESLQSREPDEAAVAAVVRSVVVRRTRRMIGTRFNADLQRGAEPSTRPRFPRRAPLRIIRYQDRSLRALVSAVGELELPVYAPTMSTSPATALVRLGLLKRLDSSPAAFRSSLVRLQELTRTALDAALAGRILEPAFSRSSGAAGDVDPLQLTLVELVARPAPPHVDTAALASALRRDLDRIRGMARLRSGPPAPNGRPAPGNRAGQGDEKLTALRGLLDMVGGEKTLVFTEYRDTAESLWHSLSGRFRVGRVDGGGAWLGRRPAGRREVVRRFAPRANGRSEPPDRERVDVLIATDVLAEGLNLQDARHVVSYDLPWNPVRLLQRIGRVDRLGSPHDEVVAYLFTPDVGLESMLGLIRRLRTKLGYIANTVGPEQADELLERLATPENADEPLARTLDWLDNQPGDPMEELRTLWLRERDRTTARLRHQGCVPAASVPVPRGHAAAGLAWIVLAEGEVDPLLLEVDRHGLVRAAGTAAVAGIRLALASERVGPVTAVDLPVAALQAHLSGAHRAAHVPAALSHHDCGVRLARRIRHAMAAAGASLDLRSVQRADAILAGLTAPLGPTQERRVRRVLARSGTADLIPLLEVSERALRNAPEQQPARVSGGVTVRVLGALRIRVDEGPARG